MSLSKEKISLLPPTTTIKRTKRHHHFYLPPELLENIYRHLSRLDQLRFVSVCKSWLSIVTANNHKSHCCDYTSLQEPFLFLRSCSNSNSNSNSNKTNLASLSEKRLYTLPNLPSPPNHCCGSSNGYLVFAEAKPELEPFTYGRARREKDLSSRLHIIDPFASARKQQQPTKNYYFTVPFYRTSVVKTLIFQTPSSLMAAVITTKGVLVVSQVGTSAWGQPNSNSYMDVVYHKGRLHGITKSGEVHVFGLLSTWVWPNSIQVDVVQKILLPWAYRCKINNNKKGRSLYLVEGYGNHKDDLLVVIKQSSGIFDVFKLDPKPCPILEEVYSLGSEEAVALFLGDNSSSCLPVERIPGFNADHIYFSGSSFPGCTNDFGVFQLGSRRLMPFPSSPCGVKSSDRTIWVTSSSCSQLHVCFFQLMSIQKQV